MIDASLSRFAGTCEWIGDADVSALVEWIASIPFSEWHQQAPIDGQLRPSMMTDLDWHGFGAITDPVVAKLSRPFGWPRTCQRMLSVIMPGHQIGPHVDEQGPHWLARIHLPLCTNDRSTFIVGGITHRLRVGGAYKVNTLVEHAVDNQGAAPRIHFMFDALL